MLQKQKSLTFMAPASFDAWINKLESRRQTGGEYGRCSWKPFENNTAIPLVYLVSTTIPIVRDGIATVETFGHTRAAPTPLQAVDDAASRTIGVSVQFGSSSH